MSEVTKYKHGEPVGQFNGRDFYGGDCWNGMPALYMTVVEETGGRYSETEEEWELFGTHLPNRVTVLKDVEVGCVKYQALVVAGEAVGACTTCPYLEGKER